MSAVPEPNWQPRLLHLWPTLITRAVLQGHEAHDPRLIALVERMDAEADQLTSRYQAVDIMALDDPSITWLRSSIDDVIARYLAAVGVDYEVRWKIRGWANVNRRGDYHSPHNHGWSYLSGTYYVRVPEQPAGAESANAASPAAISFYDPRGSVNMLARAGEAISNREHAVNPTPGTMLLWNSFLNHSVHPNLAETTRISLSFNIALAWTDELAG
jgi:uncharacterized protein (TIGR02466 family)